MHAYPRGEGACPDDAMSLVRTRGRSGRDGKPNCPQSQLHERVPGYKLTLEPDNPGIVAAGKTSFSAYARWPPPMWART